MLGFRPISELDKKGSHVGVIISFGIFVTFILFLYTALQPAFQTGDEQQRILNILEREVMDEVYANYTVISVSPDSANCLHIEDYPYSEMDSTIARDSQGNIIQSEISEGDLYVDSPDDSGLLKISSSDTELNSESGDLSDCSQDYETGMERKKKVVSKSKMVQLIENYSSSESFVREKLDFPEGEPFGFGIVYDNGTRVETESFENSREIFIREVPIQYFDENAERKGGLLVLKTT